MAELERELEASFPLKVLQSVAVRQPKVEPLAVSQVSAPEEFVRPFPVKSVRWSVPSLKAFAAKVAEVVALPWMERFFTPKVVEANTQASAEVVE
jgi:hypothetical protein